ncbi:hypothetical protein I4U23_010517 [Adineta vaga]|nr:hypothetical protein I4U23_010517 [Adineta vaga]
MSNISNSISAFVISFIALIHGSIACIISMLVFILIIYHYYKDRMKHETRITLILSANIYLLIFLYSITLVMLNIYTIVDDLVEQNFDSIWCKLRGYFVSVMLSALYNAFVVQAFFRFSRIVYFSHQSLQFSWLYIIAVPIQLFLGLIFLCPLLIWQDIIYLPNEHYCYAPFKNIRATVWTRTVNFGTSLICLSIIYVLIIRFIRQQVNNQTIATKRRQERDLLIIKRILVIVNILVIELHGYRQIFLW